MNPASYRYPGIRPFTSSESAIFFGRQADVEALTRLVRLEQAAVLYSKSGMGKSSLVNAGLFPRLKEEGRFNPFIIRFGSYAGQDGPSPADAVRSPIQPEAGAPLLEKISPDDQSLWYAFKSRQLEQAQPETAVLAFDQFEELFTYPTEHIEAFARQMAELLFIRIPQRFRQQMEQQIDTLSDEEINRLNDTIAIKAIYIIRSDRLSLLDQLRNFLPNILRHTYELAPLTRDQAMEAIVAPATLHGEFLSPPFEYTSRAIDAILDFLSDAGNEAVESFQLQIMGSYLEQKVMSQGLKIIEKEDIGNFNAVIEDFYEDRIAALNDPGQQLTARRLIEEGLIFEEEERRLSLYEGQIRQSFGVPYDLLQQLVDLRLLRAEPSLRGGYTYELAHDTLVAPVLKAKKKRMAEEAEKTYPSETPNRAAAPTAEIEILRRRNRRLRWTTTLLMAVVLILLLLLIMA